LVELYHSRDRGFLVSVTVCRHECRVETGQRTARIGAGGRAGAQSRGPGAVVSRRIAPEFGLTTQVWPTLPRTIWTPDWILGRFHPTYPRTSDPSIRCRQDESQGKSFLHLITPTLVIMSWGRPAEARSYPPFHLNDLSDCLLPSHPPPSSGCSLPCPTNDATGSPNSVLIL
jgi:hypothetical protein